MRLHPISKVVILLVLFLLPTVAMAQNWRLVQKVQSAVAPRGSQNYILDDSVDYRYDINSTLGSNYNNDTIKFNGLTHFKKNRQGQLYLYEKQIRTYNSDGQLTTTWIDNSSWGRWIDTSFYKNGLLDSVCVYRSTGGSTWIIYLDKTNKYHYNTNNLPYLIYEMQGRVAVAILDSFSREYLFYNSSNQLILSNYQKYNTNTNTWYDYEKNAYTYDANGNKMTKDLHAIDPATNKVALWYRTYYFYDMNGKLVLDSIGRIHPNSNMVPFRHGYSYDGMGRILTDTSSYVSSSSSSYRVTTYSYTSFGYINDMKILIGVPGQLLLDYVVKYTYEQYSKTASLSEVTTDKYEVELYPNPATSLLHIDSKAGFDKGYIYNNMGQMVKQVQGSAKQVDISQLPAGNYVLQLIANDEITSRQFVIAH